MTVQLTKTPVAASPLASVESIIAGLAGVGYIAFLQRGGNPLVLKNGELLASAALDRALNQQLAGTVPAGGNVQMGVSFRARNGAYCRSFVLSQAQRAGLACHQDQSWHIKALAPTEAVATSADGYRLAASELPPTVRSKIEELIDQLKRRVTIVIVTHNMQQAARVAQWR